jgi:small subunit ribosomal protein S1
MLSITKEKSIDEWDREEDDKNPVSFEEILDEYVYQRPKRGQILEGEIVAIDEDAIILDVGLKRAAIVPGREVSSLDDEDIDRLSVGDVIPIHVTRTPIGDQDLIVSIDNALEFGSWQRAEECLIEDELLEVEVIGKNKGGLLVSFDKLEGFVPNSHIPGLRKIQDHEKIYKHKQNMKGTQLKVKAIDVNPKKSRLVFSALEARRLEREQQLKDLKIGDVITGKVVNVVHFGVFVDLGWIDGLVHISELDWLNVRHPSKISKVGDEMEVQVIGVDVERERVSLSRKACLPNPWDDIEAQYVPGNLVEVEITSVVDFGAFARLPEGIHGLIHISEMGYTAPGNDSEVFEPGTKVLTQILRINVDRERIALSMRKVPIEKQMDWMLEEFTPSTENKE